MKNLTLFYSNCQLKAHPELKFFFRKKKQKKTVVAC